MIELGRNHVEAIDMDSNVTTSRRDFDNNKQTQRQTYVPILAQELFICFAILVMSVQQDGFVLRDFVCWSAGHTSRLMLLANHTISYEGGEPQGKWSEEGNEIVIKWKDNEAIVHTYKKLDKAMAWELKDVDDYWHMERCLLIRATDTVEYASTLS
jgi:hypothetical protein